MNGDLLIYAGSFLVCVMIVLVYLRRDRRQNLDMQARLEDARARGLNEPVSLHPRIDPGRCIGSGACVKACPEHHVIGLVNNKAVLINASACIGHGACEASCPMESIDLVFGTSRRGVDLPRVRPTFETNVPGLYIAGELGGMGLIRNAVTQGRQAVESIARSLKDHAVPDAGRPTGEVLDLLIVGAGPAGISAALQAGISGLRARVLDQTSPGGTILTYPRRKLVMTQPMTLPGEAPLKMRQIRKEELLDIFNSVLDVRQPEICCGRQVVEIHSQPDHFSVVARLADGSSEEHKARRLLLCIGRRGVPRRMDVPGEEQALVSYQLIEPEAYAQEACVVVGGGDSAIEGALRLAEAGASSVTLVHRGEHFNRAKGLNQQALNEAVAKGQISLQLNATPSAVVADGLQITTPAGPVLLPAGLVLVQIGGELPVGLLKQAGIIIDTHFGREVRKGEAA